MVAQSLEGEHVRAEGMGQAIGPLLRTLSDMGLVEQRLKPNVARLAPALGIHAMAYLARNHFGLHGLAMCDFGLYLNGVYSQELNDGLDEATSVDYADPVDWDRSAEFGSLLAGHELDYNWARIAAILCFVMDEMRGRGEAILRNDVIEGAHLVCYEVTVKRMTDVYEALPESLKRQPEAGTQN